MGDLFRLLCEYDFDVVSCFGAVLFLVLTYGRTSECAILCLILVDVLSERFELSLAVFL